MFHAFLKSLLTLFFLGLIFILIFTYQVWNVSTKPYVQNNHDVIVVLTGGSNRIQKGIELYEAGFAPNLFISGTHPEVKKETLLSEYELDECCIFLDAAPINTHENALDTTRWLKERNLNKLVLITSDYHMPRAMLEFENAYPEAFISPVSVKPKEFSYSFSYIWKVFLKECFKYWSVRIAQFFNIGFDHVYYS